MAGDTARRPAQPLAGRDEELGLIRSFTAALPGRGGALLLTGDPGMGKTVLLDAAAAMAAAAGARVLRGAGAEFEADVSFSGLNQVLLGIREETRRLPPAYRNALRVALGFGGGEPPGRLVVRNAALELLRQAAAGRALLVVVDDLQWLDRASAAVLGFAARRLDGSRVGFLGAARAGAATFFDRAGLPACELRPLGDEAAAGLLTARYPALAHRVRQRVLAEAQGNPLALLELPAALSGAQRSARRALPAVLPLTRRLRELFATRALALPGRTRHLLLLAVLDGTGDVGVLHAAAGIADLGPAERARLVRVDTATGRLEFRHPLTRSAVVELSTIDQRRRAHAELARLTADQPERRAWHLAGAAVEPDEEVAALLEGAAGPILRRGDATGAVAALLRAADLSPDAARRGRRMALAACTGADVTGINAMLVLSLDDFRTGRWDEAAQLVSEGLGLCETQGYRLPGWLLRYVRALLAAARGDEGTARELADALTRWAAPRRAGAVQHDASHVRALGAIGRGDFDDAYRHAAAISPPGVFPPRVPHALRVPMDLVEAAVRTGRHAEAAAHAAAMGRTGVAAISPRLALLAAGSAAIAAPDDQATALFEEAITIPEASRWPFELARVQLAYGEHLRRSRATAQARAQLAAAIDTFGRLGARPWAARAAGELRAAGPGGPAGRRVTGPGPASLTPQEYEIAALAAAGLTNKQIGARLYLSHRTVGAHLYQIFPKLGISTRAALRDALAGPESAPQAGYIAQNGYTLHDGYAGEAVHYGGSRRNGNNGNTGSGDRGDRLMR